LPRRTWKAPATKVLEEHLKTYPCPVGCSARNRMIELFGVSTTDIDNEIRTNNAAVAISKQMVNGLKMRELISKMLLLLSSGIGSGVLAKFPNLQTQYAKDPAQFMGLALGAISDFCFNMEYVRRITDSRWSYCAKSGDHMVYYPYLGVCPHCVLKVAKPALAALGANAATTDEERESRVRYFGNKIESHHVGRIGERVIVYILDLLTKSKFPQSTTLIPPYSRKSAVLVAFT